MKNKIDSAKKLTLQELLESDIINKNALANMLWPGDPDGLAKLDEDLSIEDHKRAIQVIAPVLGKTWRQI